MRNNTIIFLALACLARPDLAASDILTLQNKDNITGQVTAIDQGLIHLQSPLAAEPLLFKSEQMSSIIFESEPAKLPNKQAGLIQLRNGDQFSGDLRQLDDDKITLDTWYAGPLVIPRTDITSLYLGVNPQKLIYQGPSGLAGWEEVSGWEFEEGEFVSTGLGLMSRKTTLPEQYILTITLAWQNSPSCVIHVGGKNANPREKSDEYLITYNQSGLDLKRHAPNEQRSYLAIENLQAPPSQLQQNEAVIELRINRRTREILLYLNEQKIGRYLDPLKETPSGPYLSIESRSSERKGNIVKNIQIRKWDAVTERLQHESPPEDKSLDALTTNEGERYTGQILSFDAENKTFQVKSPLAEQAITIPADKAAVLHFKGPQQVTEKPKPVEKTDYTLALSTGGRLTLGSLAFQNESLDAIHPILGAIKLDRRILQQISLQDKKSPTQKTQ